MLCVTICKDKYWCGTYFKANSSTSVFEFASSYFYHFHHKKRIKIEKVTTCTKGEKRIYGRFLRITSFYGVLWNGFTYIWFCVFVLSISLFVCGVVWCGVWWCVVCAVRYLICDVWCVMCDVRCVGFINEKKSEKNNRFTFEKKVSLCVCGVLVRECARVCDVRFVFGFIMGTLWKIKNSHSG